MNNLMMFEGNEVEVFEYEGQVLFNPRHVGECLDLKDVTVRRSIQSMSDKQVVKLTNSEVHSMNIRKLNNRGENFLTESGVYKLIFKSKKKEAEKFQDWVTDEVLPTIRKHGAYMTENTVERALTDPDFLIQLATNLKDEQNKRRLAEEKARQEEINRIAAENTVKEKEILINTIINDKGLYAVRTVGKVLKSYNKDEFGANKIFEFMRRKHILIDKENTQNHNLPYDKYNRYFDIKYVNIGRFYNSYSQPKAYFNGKGLKWFLNHLVKQNYITNEDRTEVANALQ